MFSTSFAWQGLTGLNRNEGFQAQPVWASKCEALGLISAALGWDKSERVKASI